MRPRWKWISALIIAAVLGFGWWWRQRPSAPTPLLLAARALPAPLMPRLPASVSPAAVNPANNGGDYSDEIEICGVGKVKLDRDDVAATGKYLAGVSRAHGE